MAIFQITLRTNDDDSTAVRRLRRALKALSRAYGLRCIHIEEANNAHEHGAAELMRVFMSAANKERPTYGK